MNTSPLKSLFASPTTTQRKTRKIGLAAKLGLGLTLTGGLLTGGVAPVHAYEEDTHYLVTYTLCRSVGLTDDESKTVAMYDQAMDDSPDTDAIGYFIGLPFPQVEQEILWHALPQQVDFHMDVYSVLGWKERLFQNALNAQDRNTQLQLFGVFMHYQQDTWAHRHHPSSDYYNYTPYTAPAGHATAGHQPDRPPFDPVCAVRCLEDGLRYAYEFVRTGLRRTPNAMYNNYTLAKAEIDSNWSKKGYYFNQIKVDRSTPAHTFVTGLINAQINVYTSGIDPMYFFYYTANMAKLSNVGASFNSFLTTPNIGQFSVPLSRTPLTTLKTASLKALEGLN